MTKILTIAFSAGPEQILAVISNPLTTRFFRFTLGQSILTVVGATLLGLPTGYLLSRHRLFGDKFIRAALTVPFLFPPLVLLLGFVLVSENFISPIFNTYSPFSYSGIVIAHILYNVSLITRITESGFAGESQGLHDLARTMGSGTWSRFRDISLPQVKPALISGLLLVFLFSFNSFAIVLILGEVRLQTLEVMIYAQSRLRFNIETAAILAILQLSINLVVIAVYTRTSRSTSSLELNTLQKPPTKSLYATLFTYVIALLTWIPAMAVIYYVINQQSISLAEFFSSDYNRYLGTSSLRVILNTLFIGFIVAITAVLLSLSIVVFSYLRREESVDRLLIPLILLPMGTSAVTTGFALLQTHGQFSVFSKIVLVYIIAAQLLIAIPFATRAVSSSWENVPKEILQVTDTMDVSQVDVLRNVIFPYLRTGIFVAFLFSLAISIGEFGATFYLIRGEWTTLSLAIERLFTSRSTVLPNMYASFLVLFTLLLFWIIERVGTLELKL
jgi:thiamine transport system permease protein